jgi:hypothetical protein
MIFHSVSPSQTIVVLELPDDLEQQIALIVSQARSEEFGYVIGGFAAAALKFVHKPVERFAASFSKAVLPGAEASRAYVAFRKLEVYSDAVEAAYDADISRRTIVAF